MAASYLEYLGSNDGSPMLFWRTLTKDGESHAMLVTCLVGRM